MLENNQFLLVIIDAELQKCKLFGTFKILREFASNYEFWMIERVKDNCIIARSKAHYDCPPVNRGVYYGMIVDRREAI